MTPKVFYARSPLNQTPHHQCQTAMDSPSSSGESLTSASGHKAPPADIVARCAAIVGADHVLADPASLARYINTTLPRHTTPALVVRPADVDQVRRICELASQLGLKTHAISCGKNWGYGDACAPEDGRLIVDLGLMNRIIEVNEQLAYVVIEPGVTQKQLTDELDRLGSRLMADVTGAGPDASIVGNVLQRGFGHTPYGDRSVSTCNFEVVLPDGQLHRTGFGDIDASPVGHVYPYGRGPDTRGQFTQSDAGIVTRMTVWLMPRPAAISAFFLRIDSDEQFARAIDCVSQLRQNGTINSVVHIANDLRVLSAQSWAAEIDHPPGALPESTRDQYRKRAGIARWNALGGLYGSRREVRAKQKEIRSAFRGICRIIFVNRRLVEWLRTSSRIAPAWMIPERLANLTSSISDVYQLLNGYPSEKHLAGAFYRNRPDSGEVIDAGLIWMAPVIPCTGKDAIRLADAITAIANAHGFDLPMTISPVTPRAAVCVTNLSYDKSDRKSAERARIAYGKIRAELDRLGYPPYRTASVKLDN